MIESLPAPERPRERCLDKGARCLSLRELLAVVLGTGPSGIGCLGVAESVLARPGSGLSEVDRERAFFTSMEVSGAAHLLAVPGLGEAGRARLLAAFELGRRYATHRSRAFGPLEPPGSLRPGLRLPPLARTALDRVSPTLRSEPQEWLGFVPLYRTGELGELALVERGVRTHVNIDPAELFARLLALRPHGFYLLHNHPSGNTRPSAEDFELTRSVGEISRRLGVRLLGHWVVAAEGEDWIAV